MPELAPYLNFKGNCEQAFEFYKSVFGGEYATFVRFSEMPPMPGAEMPPHVAKLISHVALPIGHGILMGSDAPEGSGPPHKQGNNFSISINVESKEEAKKLFNGLSAGGNVTMPLDDAPWGAYFGMWEDKFGINWMVNHDERQK